MRFERNRSGRAMTRPRWSTNSFSFQPDSPRVGASRAVLARGGVAPLPRPMKGARARPTEGVHAVSSRQPGEAIEEGSDVGAKDGCRIGPDWQGDRRAERSTSRDQVRRCTPRPSRPRRERRRNRRSCAQGPAAGAARTKAARRDVSLGGPAFAKRRGARRLTRSGTALAADRWRGGTLQHAYGGIAPRHEGISPSVGRRAPVYSGRRRVLRWLGVRVRAQRSRTIRIR